MPDRAPREQWSQSHRIHMFWFGKGIAAIAFLYSLYAVPRYEAFVRYFFVGVGAIGVWNLFPSFRPLISWVVRRIVSRLPFLKNGNNNEPPPPIHTSEFPAFRHKDEDDAP